MIANYTNPRCQRTELSSWIRTGMAVAAFGVLLVKLNVFPQNIQERVLTNWKNYRYQGG
jgi:uncharacterized membrane protein YidH (DUF202 family)